MKYDGHDLTTDWNVNIQRGFLGFPEMRAVWLRRSGDWPIATGQDRTTRILTIALTAKDKSPANLSAIRRKLLRWLDLENEDVHTLTLDADSVTGLPERFVEVLPQKVDVGPDWVVRVTLAVSDDVRFRNSPSTWLIVGSMTTDTGVIDCDVTGDDNAYPVIQLVPQKAKTGGTGYAYRRWSSIWWSAPLAATRYPVLVAKLDTEQLVADGKAQSDGDDIRVFVDGAEVDRWMSAVNPPATSGESIAAADGSTTSFSGTLANAPVQPNTVVARYTISGTAYTAPDDGAGNISGTDCTGTIDYRIGYMTLTFSTAPDDGTYVGADYHTATNVWINLDFDAAQQVTLKTGFAAADTVTELQANEDIGDFPSSGILLIDAEVFTYSSVDIGTRTFSGVSRAAKGSTAADHAAGAAVKWIQHDIWVAYGNSSSTAPDQDDDYQPVLNVTDSDNTTWIFDSALGEDDGLRAGQWTRTWTDMKAGTAGASYSRLYTGGGATYANPWTTITVYDDESDPDGYQHWELYSPTKFSHVKASGTCYHTADGPVCARLNSTSYPDNWPSSGIIDTCSTTSADATIAWDVDTWAADFYVGIGAYLPGSSYFDITSVTVTIANPPEMANEPELQQYTFDILIKSTTTGDQMRLSANVALNDAVVIDCKNNTVTCGNDNLRNTLEILEPNSARQHWLRLVPTAISGSKDQIYFADTGTQQLEISLKWDERYYE